MSNLCRDNALQNIGVKNLDFSRSCDVKGHVIGHVIIRFAICYPYCCCFGTALSNGFRDFEILGLKHIGVTTLTCQGHVTSSVMWPFDLQKAISYWWSFGTKSISLSRTVSEIFGAHHASHAESSLRKRDHLIMYNTCYENLSIGLGAYIF